MDLMSIGPMLAQACTGVALDPCAIRVFDSASRKDGATGAAKQTDSGALIRMQWGCDVKNKVDFFREQSQRGIRMDFQCREGFSASPPMSGGGGPVQDEFMG